MVFTAELAAAARRPPFERPLVPALLFTAMVPVGFALVQAPFLAAGAIFGCCVLAAVLFHPLAVIGVMLLIGPIDLSFMTGGFKALIPSMGGLDMNGIRLIGVSLGLAVSVFAIAPVRRVLLSRYGIFYLGVLCFGALTLVRSGNPVDGMRLLLKIAYPLLFFGVIVGLTTERRQLDRLIDFTLIGAALIALVLNPVYAMAGGYRIYDSGHTRVYGVGIHENPLSFYLLITLYIAFARFAVRGQWRYLLLCGALGFWMILSITRITFAAGAVGLAGLAVYATVTARSPRVLLGATIIALAVGIPFLRLVLERSLGFVPSPGELLALARSPAALYESIDWSGRQVIWPVLFAAFLAQPWFGQGLGSSVLVMREHFPPYAGELPHNEYLRLGIDTGLLGVTLFGVAILIWFAAVLRADRDTAGAAREFTWPALAGLLSWAVIACTDNAFDYYAPFTQFVGVLVAASVAAAVLARRERSAPPDRPLPGAPPMRLANVAPVLALVVATGCGDTFGPQEGDNPYVAVGAGYEHTCALRANGSVYCWGTSSRGELGNGDWTYSARPVRTSSTVSFTAISAGAMHTCAIDEASVVHCWGGNSRYQLGTGDQVTYNRPTPVATPLRFARVSSGWFHTCAVTTAGDAHCWGRGEQGELGTGGTETAPTPERVLSPEAFAEISAGGFHTCALRANGAAFCWGANHEGQLGDGTTASSLTPRAVAGELQFRTVEAGYLHTCGVTTAGELYCWGGNAHGELGRDPAGAPAPRSLEPAIVSRSVRFGMVAAGQRATCAVTEAGGVWCWGDGGQGQLGDGHAVSRSTPAPIAQGAIRDGATFAAVSTALKHTCAMTTAGEIYCWGSGPSGELGNGRGTMTRSAVRVLRSDS